MDFKEYLAIFKSRFRTFAITVIIFILAGVLFQLLRPLSYKSSLTLNVTRIGSQQTPDYRYDDFYRLQADEKFSDTVVRWLGSPRIATDILNDSKIITSGLSQWKLKRYFKAQRLSSQMISVTYTSKNADTAKDLAGSIVKILNSETEKLNKTQNEESWFMIVSNDPVVSENTWPWSIVILFSALLGIFAAFWAVLIKHYVNN